MPHFDSLDPETKALVQEKQNAAASRRRKLKEKRKAQLSGKSSNGGDDDHESLDAIGSLLATFPSSITQDQYFEACPAGLFSDPQLVAGEKSVRWILKSIKDQEKIGTFRDGTTATMAHFNYFLFAGSDADVWSATSYARQAWEGFFTITGGGRRPGGGGSKGDPDPLAELQPFYSVIGWPQFEAAGQVRRTFGRLGSAARGGEGGPEYLLRAADDGGAEVWRQVEAYQRLSKGRNWLTPRCFSFARVVFNVLLRLVVLCVWQSAAGLRSPALGQVPRPDAASFGRPAPQFFPRSHRALGARHATRQRRQKRRRRGSRRFEG